jgi:OPT oligopeptide transporter protein
MFAVPIGVDQAMTMNPVGLDIIMELVLGYAQPVRPVAMMMFKTWGYMTMSRQQSLTVKLGHYVKIPHCTVFLRQIVATFVSGTAQLGVY